MEQKHTINDSWQTESAVSRTLVAYLKNKGYDVVKDNSENVYAKGEDILAKKEGLIEVIEVKGYPSKKYADPRKAHLEKRTNPKLQCTHWFAACITSCIYNYRKFNTDKHQLAMAFPENESYYKMISKVEDFFTDNNIDLRVYFITEKGNVIITNLDRNKR